MQFIRYRNKMRFLTICVLLIASVVRAEIPGNFPRCHNGDSECMTKSANAVIQQYFGGLRDINLLPFDPLRIKSLTIARNPSSPVNVELKFTNAELIGLKNLKVKSLTGLSADFTGNTVMEADAAEIRLKGTYSMDGRILLLPIVGEGPCEITLTNVHFKVTTQVKPVIKNGQTYGHLDDVKLVQKPGLVHFQLDNLFNGDKALGDNMNKVLNDSWKEVYGELDASFSEGIALIAKQLLNNMMESHPYADFFI